MFSKKSDSVIQLSISSWACTSIMFDLLYKFIRNSVELSISARVSRWNRGQREWFSWFGM